MFFYKRIVKLLVVIFSCFISFSVFASSTYHFKFESEESGVKMVQTSKQCMHGSDVGPSSVNGAKPGDGVSNTFSDYNSLGCIDATKINRWHIVSVSGRIVATIVFMHTYHRKLRFGTNAKVYRGENTSGAESSLIEMRCFHSGDYTNPVVCNPESFATNDISSFLVIAH